MLIIALTIIGIPVSIVLGMAYGALLFLSKVVVAYFVGQRLSFGGDTETGVIVRTGVSLLAILFVIEIPFLGGGLHFLVHIFGLGVLLVHLRNLYLARREPPPATPGEPGVLAAG
jgi:hypothetical protein